MYGLDPDTTRNIKQTIAKIGTIDKVILYGSRAKDNYRNGSDIDITLIGKDLTLDNSVYPLMDELEELYLPYTFDISIFNYIDNKNLIEHINRVGKLFYEKEKVLPDGWEVKKIFKIGKTFAAIEKAKQNAERNLRNAKELFKNYLNDLFENPSKDWNLFTLNELCTKITDGVYKKPNYITSGAPFIKISNLTEGQGISFNNVSYITQEDHELFCQRTKPEKGDILITKDGTIGVVRVIETDIEFSIFVSVALIKPKSKRITPFLKYVLLSPLIQNQINPQGTSLKHLYLRDLRKYKIPIPSVDVQESIVNQLDTLLYEINNAEILYQKKIDNLLELKKSILQKSFVGEL